MNYTITNKNNKYITRKTLNSDYTFTDNKEFALILQSIEHAEFIKNILETERQETELKIITI